MVWIVEQIISVLESIVNVLGSIVGLLLDGLKALFIPSDDFIWPFDSFINTVKGKFLYVQQITEAVENLRQSGKQWTFELPYGVQFNMDWYEPYRIKFRTYMSASLYFMTMFGIVKALRPRPVIS